MTAAPKQKTSGYARDTLDWYIEPAWTVDALCEYVRFRGTVHDPACGKGTIPARLTLLGRDVTHTMNPGLPTQPTCLYGSDVLVTDPCREL